MQQQETQYNMNLMEALSALFATVGADVRQLTDQISGGSADLSALTTTAKGNLVEAINEVNAKPSGSGTSADVGDTTVDLSAIYTQAREGTV